MGSYIYYTPFFRWWKLLFNKIPAKKCKKVPLAGVRFKIKLNPTPNLKWNPNQPYPYLFKKQHTHPYNNKNYKINNRKCKINNCKKCGQSFKCNCNHFLAPQKISPIQKAIKTKPNISNKLTVIIINLPLLNFTTYIH